MRCSESFGRTFAVAVLALCVAAVSAGAMQVQKNGWAVNADADAEKLTVSSNTLDEVLEDVSLAVKNGGSFETLSDWSVDVSNGNLVVEASSPGDVVVTISVGENGVDVKADRENVYLLGTAPAGEDRLTARVASQDNDVMYSALGPVSAGNIYNLFDQSTNTMIEFPEQVDLAPKAVNPSELEMTCPVVNGPEISVTPRYYRKMGLKFYKPMPDRFDHPSVGWDSWYAYYMGATQEDMVKETNAIAEKLKPYGMQYVQLDACFTRGKDANWLEWNEDTFPKGGKWLFQYIKSKGLKPGLWINIYGANKANPAFGDRFPNGKYPEDFFLEDKNGKYHQACCTADSTVKRLDFTNPAVLEHHLKPLFQTLVNEWDLEYLKDAGWGTWMDYYKKNRERAHDPNIGSREGYMKAQNIVRDVMGPQNYILGCAMHEVGLGFGIFDGSRTGGDDYASWKGRHGGMQTYFNSLWGQQWLNGITWWSHPDATMIRAPLTMDEARTIVTSISLTGQTYMTSDFFADIKSDRAERVKKTSAWAREFPELLKGMPEKRLDLYRSTMPSRPIRAIDLYPFKQKRPRCCPKPKEYPAALDLKVNKEAGQYDVVGVFNWKDEPATRSVNFAEDFGLDADQEFIVFDFWKKQLLGVESGGMELDVPTHGVRALILKPLESRPKLLGTSRHITGTYSIKTLEWDADASQISGMSTTVAGDTYTLYFYVPKGVSVANVEATAPSVASSRAGRLLKVSMDGQGEPVNWSVQFESK